MVSGELPSSRCILIYVESLQATKDPEFWKGPAAKAYRRAVRSYGS